MTSISKINTHNHLTAKSGQVKADSSLTQLNQKTSRLMQRTQDLSRQTAPKAEKYNPSEITMIHPTSSQQTQGEIDPLQKLMEDVHEKVFSVPKDEKDQQDQKKPYELTKRDEQRKFYKLVDVSEKRSDEYKRLQEEPWLQQEPYELEQTWENYSNQRKGDLFKQMTPPQKIVARAAWGKSSGPVTSYPANPNNPGPSSSKAQTQLVPSAAPTTTSTSTPNTTKNSSWPEWFSNLLNFFQSLANFFSTSK